MTRNRPPRKYHPPRWGLFGLACVGIGSGLGYFPFINPMPPTARGLQILTMWVPMWVFALAWTASGVIVAVAAMRRRPGWTGVGLIVMMMMLWGSFLLLGWVVDWAVYGIHSRAYITAVVYLGLGTYIVGNVPPDPTPGSEIVAKGDR